MNREQIEGIAKNIKGDIKKALGEATNDPVLKDEGLADKAEGKVQKGIGDLKAKIDTRT